MTVRARFRYLSAPDPDDTSPISLPGDLGAVPGIVEPGDVFEVVLDDTRNGTTLDETGATVEISLADLALGALDADPRFERVADDEDVTSAPLASDGMTAADLRLALETLAAEGADVPERLPRKRDDLADLYDGLVGPPVPSEIVEL